MATDNPWEPFDRLREALKKAVEPLGITIHDWMVFPDAKNTNVIFIVNPEAFLTNEERETRKQFEEMMSEQARHELQQRSKKAVEDLLKDFGVSSSE